MSRKVFILPAALAFLMCLISVYFGASIFNANENVHIGYLNEMDQLDYYDAAMVPALSSLAAILTLPFILGITGAEIFIALRSKVRAVKRISLALIACYLLVALIAILTLANPVDWDFSHTGYLWVFSGLFTIAGNIVSVFLK